MLVDYLTLGLSPQATDDQIRKQYLGLLKKHPPEVEPHRFQEITSAYERIKDEPSRLQTKIIGPLGVANPERALVELIRAATPCRRRVGLKALLDAAGPAPR